MKQTWCAITTAISLLIISICHYPLLFVDGVQYSRPSDLELVFVHALWRHGDRSPALVIPTDTQNPASSWPQGLGELSQKGMRQHYELGQYLRKRYDGFVDREYKADQVYIRSTGYNRTIMSALSNMAGFYAPQGHQIWNKNISWQPVPVHSVPKEDDPVSWMEFPCKMEQEAFEKTINSADVKKLLTEHEKLFKTLRKETGFPLETFDTIWKIFDVLNCEKEHSESHPWPKWVTSELFENISKLNDISTKYYDYTPEVQRFRSGLMLTEIYDRHNLKIKSLETPNEIVNLKYYVYSAHDTTLLSLMSAMGLFNDMNPPYASAVLLELLRKKGTEEFFLDVFYRNDTQRSEPYRLRLPHCQNDPCTLAEFNGHTAGFRLTRDQYDRECAGSGDSKFVDFFAKLSPQAWLTICGTLIFIILIQLVLLFYTFLMSKADTNVRYTQLSTNAVDADFTSTPPPASLTDA